MKKKSTPAPSLSNKQKVVMASLTGTASTVKAAKRAAPPPKAPPPPKAAVKAAPKPEKKPAPPPARKKSNDVEPFSCWKRGQYVYEVLRVYDEDGIPMVHLRGGRHGTEFATEVSKLIENYDLTDEEPTNVKPEPPAAPAPTPRKKAAPEPKADELTPPTVEPVNTKVIQAVAPPEFLVTTTVDLTTFVGDKEHTLPAGSRGWVANFQRGLWFAPEKKVGSEYMDLLPIFPNEFVYRKPVMK
jgi:hypothetical protein